MDIHGSQTISTIPVQDNRYSNSRPYRPGIDVNLYATKKSVAQGMMDIALLTANASQLKYILREGDDSRFYFVNVICIGISIALQVSRVFLYSNCQFRCCQSGAVWPGYTPGI